MWRIQVIGQRQLEDLHINYVAILAGKQSPPNNLTNVLVPRAHAHLFKVSKLAFPNRFIQGSRRKRSHSLSYIKLYKISHEFLYIDFFRVSPLASFYQKSRAVSYEYRWETNQIDQPKGARTKLNQNQRISGILFQILFHPLVQTWAPS